MTTSQLAKRLGVTRQAAVDLEQREKRGTITLATMRRAAEAMNCDVVYAVVPRTALSEMIDRQARIQASRQLSGVAHTMHLEAQGVPQAEHERQVRDRADRLRRSWSRTLWDADPP